MTKIETITKWLKEPESKKILAPKTLTSCVYDENGETVETRLNEVFQSVSNGKSLIASAITDKGITTEADATFQTMADNIGKISVSGSAEVSNPLSMIGNYNFQSKIVLADELSADSITITKDSTNIQITSVEKTSDTNFKVTGDFSAISAGDVIKVQTNPGLFFDANLRSISDVSVVIGDTRFEIKNPDLLQKVKVCSVGGRDYYAYSSVIPTSYWAIGLLATTTEGYTVPIIVSDVREQASATTSYAPTMVYGDILNFEYNGKTYYCNSGIYGAEVGPAIDNIIPIYNGAAFANNKDGWLSMAKKLLDFYFGKEEFPSET